MALVYTHIASNKRKTWFLLGLFLLLIIALGWTFSYGYNEPGILYVAVIFSVGYALISYYFSSNITLALSRAKEIDRQTNKELYQLVENLSIAAGLPTPKIYIINDTALNAFATGRDPNHAVMVFTSGIIERLNRAELEGVAAHELSHIGNYDIRLMTLVVVLVGVITLLADFFLRFSLYGGRGRNREGGGQVQAIMIAGGLVLALLSPVIAALIQLAVSRRREYLADADAVLLTRYPEGLAQALEKISHDPEPLEVANKATAHLYIANPLKNRHKGVGWFSKLFNTHPPVQERIKRLREMGG